MDLEVFVSPRPDGGLQGRVVYSTELFDAGTVERMTAHFVRLLGAAAAAPDRPLSEVSLLEPAERHQLLVEWNDTAREVPEATVAELFEAQVGRSPDAVALVFEDQALSYGELDERANRLAHYLRGLGVGPEVVVGLCLERSTEMVVALLAILKAGGAYLPLDPDYPASRLQFMAEDAAAPLVVTTSDLAATLGLPSAHLVLVDANADAIAACASTKLATAAGPGNLAYVIYTSGSTGRPKGVMVSHRGVVDCLHGCPGSRFCCQTRQSLQ